MESRDLLGGIGREHIKACVKVKIFNQHKVRKYSQDEATERVNACLSHPISDEDFLDCVQPRKETFSIADIHHVINLLKQDNLKENQHAVEASARRIDVQRELDRYNSNKVTEVHSHGTNQQREEMSKAKEKISEDAYDYVGATASIPEGVEGGNIAVVRGSQQYPVEQTELEEFNSDSQRKEPWGQQGIVFDYEIDFGTGFVIDTHFIDNPGLLSYYDYIVTCKHVIQAVLDDEGKEVRIWNTVFDDLPCEVVAADASTDLALLCCRDPKMNKSEIPRLELCGDEPLTGQEIFSFGYPATYTGENALFSKGCVAGSQERYGKPNVKVLDCPAVSHGCSGAPVMQWIDGKIKVLAVITQKHKKEILSITERERVEEIIKSMTATSITDSQSTQEGVHILVVKLYNALETHSPFTNCNAIPVVTWPFLCAYPMNRDLSNG